MRGKKILQVLFIKEFLKKQKLIFYTFDNDNEILFKEEIVWTGNYYHEIEKLFPLNFNPEIIVFWGPEYYHIPFGIENSDSFLVLCICDWDMSFVSILNSINLFDCVFIDQKGYEVLKKFNVKNVESFTIPVFYLENLEKYQYSEEKEYDVVFIGSIRHDMKIKRSKYLFELTKLSEHFNIKILDYIYEQDYYNTISKGKIIFNYSMRSELNMRFFESLYVNSLALIEDTNLEVSKYFKENEHYITFNLDNLNKKIEYYIKNEFERKKIVEQGNKEYYSKNHKYFIKLLIERILSVKDKFLQTRQKNHINEIYFYHSLNSVNPKKLDFCQELSEKVKGKDSFFYNNLACLYARKSIENRNIFINKRVESLLIKALELDKSNFIAKYNLLSFYITNLNTEKAINIANELLKDINLISYDLLLRNSLLFKEFSYFENMVQEYIFQGKKISDIFKSNILYLLSFIYKKTDINKSINYIIESIEIDNSNPYSYELLGNLFEEKEEYSKAIANYRKSLNIYPFNFKCWNNLLNVEKKAEHSFENTFNTLIKISEAIPQTQKEVYEIIKSINNLEIKVKYYSNSLYLFPFSVKLLIELSQVFYEKEEYYSSIKILNYCRYIINNIDISNKTLFEQVNYLLALSSYEVSDYTHFYKYFYEIDNIEYTGNLKRLERNIKSEKVINILESLNKNNSFILLKISREYFIRENYEKSLSYYFETIKYAFAEDNEFIQKIVFSEILSKLNLLEVDEETINEIIDEGEKISSEFIYFWKCLSDYYKSINLDELSKKNLLLYTQLSEKIINDFNKIISDNKKEILDFVLNKDIFINENTFY